MPDTRYRINRASVVHHASCSVVFCLLLLFAACSSARYVSRPEERYESLKPAVSETTAVPETRPSDAKYLVASWYGPDFHGKPTSSGETYNMYARTCAHKEYPFGSKLKVTNVSNGEFTECIVNDRGPFVAGRDLDLSYACAKEIGLIGTGTGKVRIDYLGRDTSYVKEVRYLPARPDSEGPFTIQIGSYKDLSNAARLKKALDYKYGKVYVIAAEVNDSTYYRVRIGKFNTKEDVYPLAKTLADEGYNVLITHYDERI